MTSTSAARLGRIGEQMAARHLQRCGFQIVARNWRSDSSELRGELDIVAWDGDTLVFCEVKARRGEDAGGPLAAVTPAKVVQLRRLAGAFLAERSRNAGPAGTGQAPVRIDVVGVCWPSTGGRAGIDHIRDIDDIDSPGPATAGDARGG